MSSSNPLTNRMEALHHSVASEAGGSRRVLFVQKKGSNREEFIDYVTLWFKRVGPGMRCHKPFMIGAWKSSLFVSSRTVYQGAALALVLRESPGGGGSSLERRGGRVTEYWKR